MKYTLDFENKVIILLEECNLGELLDNLKEEMQDWTLSFVCAQSKPTIVKEKNEFLDLINKVDRYASKNPYTGGETNTNTTYSFKDNVNCFIKRFS